MHDDANSNLIHNQDTKANSCVCVEDAHMHLTLGFLGSNSDFGLAAYLRNKNLSKKSKKIKLLEKKYYQKIQARLRIFSMKGWI